MFGALNWRSPKVSICCNSKLSVLKAVTAIGTSCIFSSVFCAVTIISSIPPLSSVCALTTPINNIGIKIALIAIGKVFLSIN